MSSLTNKFTDDLPLSQTEPPSLFIHWRCWLCGEFEGFSLRRIYSREFSLKVFVPGQCPAQSLCGSWWGWRCNVWSLWLAYSPRNWWNVCLNLDDTWGLTYFVDASIHLLTLFLFLIQELALKYLSLFCSILQSSFLMQHLNSNIA